MRPQSLILFASLLSSVQGALKLTSPTSSTRLAGGTALTIKWESDGSRPEIKDLTSYTVELCVGSNELIMPVVTLVSGAVMPQTGDKAELSVVVPRTAGESGKFYFLRMTSVATAGGTLTLYSPRFTLTSMTGTFSPAMEAANEDGEGQPTLEEEDKTVAPPRPNAPANDEEVVTYTRQTGKTRFAPMQTQPGKRITAKETKRQYPTSTYTVFTTRGPKPNVETTVTRPWNYKVVSLENTAAPQKFIGTRME